MCSGISKLGEAWRSVRATPPRFGDALTALGAARAPGQPLRERQVRRLVRRAREAYGQDKMRGHVSVDQGLLPSLQMGFRAERLDSSSDYEGMLAAAIGRLAKFLGEEVARRSAGWNADMRDLKT